jgi:hypothetical protein
MIYSPNDHKRNASKVDKDDAVVAALLKFATAVRLSASSEPEMPAALKLPGLFARTSSTEA